ncbi:MAG: serine hydrolase [Prolixibacteraceae bacterium]|jgi:CubicO group peptidase (beta-lactamase class C family)|nr:serine hydrolase [Prolixibacteraceae bacterium]
MSKKIFLLLFCSFFAIAVSAQKRGKTVKVSHTAHPVKILSSRVITPLRTLRFLRREEAKNSLVVLKNSGQLLPLNRLDTLKILIVNIGFAEGEVISPWMNRYTKTDHLTLDPYNKPGSVRTLQSISGRYNLIVYAVGDQCEGLISKTDDNHLSAAVLVELGAYLVDVGNQLASDVAKNAKSVYLLFGSARFFASGAITENSSALLVAEKADYDRIDLLSQLLFGAIPSNGKLTNDLGIYKMGDGIIFPSIGRLSYVLPEEVGIDSLSLAREIDSLVNVGLKGKAFPGCQLLLARNGKVFYQKSYGFHTYSKNVVVRDDDLYDLASVTKVLAPVPALMMLADQKKFVVTKRMSDYWPDWKGSNKVGILVSDLLSHQARLRAGVILWPNTVDDKGNYKPGYYVTKPTPGFDLRVSEGLYLVDSFKDTVYKSIRDSPLLKMKKYAYSDLGFVILPKVIEHLSGKSFEQFLHEKLYAKLGAASLMYLPALSQPKDKIVPTEEDQSFRHELLQGYVHDETAALMGGVSGNAGLFGSVGDVAKVMQLYLQNGEYGNEKFIREETVKNWTSSHFQKSNNRRGYGFDKPGIQMNRHTGKERYPSIVVSGQSFGHSGYTGTFVWADPANQLLFVFLSNRVFPDRDNHRINKLRLRPMLLETLFKLAGQPAIGR